MSLPFQNCPECGRICSRFLGCQRDHEEIEMIEEVDEDPTAGFLYEVCWK